jgi:uncharacterized protein DUF1360
MSEWGPLPRLLLAVLATWRLTHLLAREDGPADVIVRVRARLGAGFLGRLLDCFYCLSLWVAAPMAVFVSRRPLEGVLSWLAVSGAACLLERLGHDPVVIQPDPGRGEGGDADGMLRSETHGGGAGIGHATQDDPAGG